MNDTAPIFEERQRLSRTVLLLILALQGGTIIVLTTLTVANAIPLSALLLTIGLITFFIFVFLIWPTLIVRVHDDAIRWSWLPYAKGTIPLDAIKNVDTINVDPLNHYGGWGPKFSRERKRFGFGLITQGGNAVRIHWLTKNRPTVITSQRPEELAALILERVVDRGGQLSEASE